MPTHEITAMTMREAIDRGLFPEGTVTATKRGTVWLTFDAAGQQLYRGRLPYCGTARVLVGQGIDPEDILQGRTPEGMKTISAKIGVFAKLTVVQHDPSEADMQAGKHTYRAEHWAPYVPYLGQRSEPQ